MQAIEDGVFKAELNELLTRELAEDGYSGVTVRRTTARTDIIIRATRTQKVLGALCGFSAVAGRLCACRLLVAPQCAIWVAGNARYSGPHAATPASVAERTVVPIAGLELRGRAHVL